MQVATKVFLTLYLFALHRPYSFTITRLPCSDSDMSRHLINYRIIIIIIIIMRPHHALQSICLPIHFSHTGM